MAQSPKVLPGVFIYDLGSTDYFKASHSGNSLALKRGSYQYAFFDVQKGIISQVDRNIPGISSNHRYFFSNRSFQAGRSPNNETRYAWEIQSAGVSTDTVTRRIVTDHQAMDIDEKGNYIATKIWYDSAESYSIKGMKGIYKLDRATGKVVQALREDTLFSCTERRGCSSQGLYLQKNYFAFSVKKYLEPIDIYLFDGSKKITIPAHNYHTVYADSLILFTVGDSTLNYRKLAAFDVRTGQQLAQETIPRTSYYGQLFDISGNKLYILQSALNRIEEWSVRREGFAITKTWDISTNMGLSNDQQWNFTVVKGPSFFVVPTTMTKGEAGGMAANTAHFLNGTSSKITFQVYPFYNRTPADVAIYNKNKKESDDFLAKIKAEKDSIAHPERYCHHFWDKGDWRRGITIFWGGAYHILADYDCKGDQYKLWRPAQLYNGNGHYMEAKYVMVSGRQYREGGNRYYSRKQYVTCAECDGDGTYEVTTYTTKTKDLPWGYFSGIETKKITTTSTTTKWQCPKCMGNGIVLK